MHVNWQTLYYSLAAIGLLLTGAIAGARYFARAVSFFSRLDTKVDAIDRNVHVILNNHLPHIYQRLGEEFEIRQDSTRDPRRNREDRKALRSDEAVFCVEDGRDDGSNSHGSGN